jgi:hypothetical protein
MRGAGDEIKLASPESFHRPGDWKQQLQLQVQTFAREVAKLDAGDDRKIGIGDEVGDGDLEPLLND